MNNHYFYFKFVGGDEEVEFVTKLSVKDKGKNGTRIIERMEMRDVLSFVQYSTLCFDLTSQMRVKSKEDGFIRPMSMVEIEECLKSPELTNEEAVEAVKGLYFNFKRSPHKEVSYADAPYDEAMKVVE